MPTRRKTRRPQPITAKKRRAPVAQQKVQILSSDDVRRMLLDLANRMAPGDVDELLMHESELRARVADLPAPHLALFEEQLGLAVDCLRDHAEGRCPQIPYFTISLLVGALWYFLDELDAVPDFLPRVGELDDALMLAMAFQLGEDGLRRYCTWKGRPAEFLFGAAAARRLRRPAPKAARPGKG
jgi:uncharacterized membrane protein YkvA (DUF1232 family)